MAEQHGLENLDEIHSPDKIASWLEQGESISYLGDAVLGALDGAVTTFAIVTGVIGSQMPATVAIVLGFANLLADGFSMAASNYESTKSEQQRLDRARLIENEHIDQIPEGEREEIRQIFGSKGFEGELLEEITEVITRDRELWINTMLTEEWGFQLRRPVPWRAAMVTFAAFVTVGLVPLLPLIIPGLPQEQRFTISLIGTIITFAAVGVVKGKILHQPLLRSGLGTLLTGGGAALLAYLIGFFLHKLYEIPVG